MDSLRDLAGRIDDATETLAELARRLPYVGAAGDALHADGPGRPGEIGRALRRQWETILDDRVRELTGAADRLTDTAAALRTAAEWYADSDDAAEQRFLGGATGRYAESGGRYAEGGGRYAEGGGRYAEGGGRYAEGGGRGTGGEG
ncbi:hypothetical protein [Plantactinospora sp. B5E13]|uniref:hypothetical protein n=1 Tax=unclassified Plantactinospora TaxID=2631981 RepID=UPI00325F4236